MDYKEKILLYKDEDKSLYQSLNSNPYQGGNYILFDKSGVNGERLFELPDWYHREVRDKKIKDILNKLNTKK